MMAFTRWQDFFAMGGYSLYIWLAVLLTLLPLAGLIVTACWQQRAILRAIRGGYAREQRIRAAEDGEVAQ